MSPALLHATMDPVSYVSEPAATAATAAHTQLSLSAFTNADGQITSVQITPPTTAPKQPSLFICVLDVSGSMGTSAAGTSAGDQSPDALFSRLDLVKHSMNTLIQGVEEDDYVAIIPFNGAAALSLPATKMTQSGRERATSTIGRMYAGGGTNIWAGLEIAINQAAANKDKNPLILLLTDGEPNIDPPRGLVPTIQQTLQSLGLHVPIHTFGFGYDMNSRLINSISDATAATYAFIPDCSMVGTVFINFIANALASIAHYMTLTTPDNTTFNIYGIQPGQTRTVFLPPLSTSEADQKFLLRLGTKAADGHIVSIRPETPEIKFAQNWLLALVQANNAAAGGDLQKAREAIAALAAEAPPSYKLDLSSPDDGAGQIGKALEKPEWWQRWGRHYLPSVISAHRQQVCNNFKDKAIQSFGGQAFREHQARLEKLFLSIPPPACSIQPIASRSYYGSGSASATYSSVSSVDMNNYYNAGGGCFSGLNRVLTQSGEKVVKDVKKGDVLRTILPDGSESTGTVICSVVSKPPGGTMDLVTIAGLKITPWHPMKMVAGEQTWHFPGDLAKAIGHRADEAIDEVYTFVMDQGHVVVVEGFPVCTLGHGFKGAVIEHAYFGTQAIIDDLKQLDGWEDGRVLYNDLKKLAANKYSAPSATMTVAVPEAPKASEAQAPLQPASFEVPTCSLM